MIRVFKDWKLFLEYPEYKMKNITDIKLIFCDLWMKWLLKTIKIPELCEEWYKYSMRENWFTLQSY